jgi:hypothetical protein
MAMIAHRENALMIEWTQFTNDPHILAQLQDEYHDQLDERWIELCSEREMEETEQVEAEVREEYEEKIREKISERLKRILNDAAPDIAVALAAEFYTELVERVRELEEEETGDPGHFRVLSRSKSVIARERARPSPPRELSPQ